MEAITTTVEITAFGQTRTLEIRSWGTTHGAHTTTDVFVATIGRGAARYPINLDLHKLADGATAPRGTTVVTAANGHRFTWHLGTTVRNRQARIVGWADTAGVTNAIDQTRA